MKLNAERIEVADMHEAIELFFQQKWSDGLPVVPPSEVKVEEMMNEARALAAKFVTKPRESLEKSKHSYNMVLDMGHKAAVNWETQLLCHLFDSEERKEIMARFLHKK